MRFQAAGHPGLFRRLFLPVPGGKRLPLPAQGLLPGGLCLPGLGSGPGQAFLGPGNGLGAFALLLLQLSQAVLLARLLLLEVGNACFLLGQLVPQAAGRLVPGAQALPAQGQGLAAVLRLLADGLQPLAQALPLGLLVPQVVQQAFALGVQPVRLLGAGGEAGLGSRPVGLELAALRPLLVQLVHPEGNFQRPQLLPQGQEGLRLLGLGLQRTPLEVQLL